MLKKDILGICLRNSSSLQDLLLYLALDILQIAIIFRPLQKLGVLIISFLHTINYMMIENNYSD